MASSGFDDSFDNKATAFNDDDSFGNKWSDPFSSQNSDPFGAPASHTATAAPAASVSLLKSI
jgi:predicted P-loop ATPase